MAIVLSLTSLSLDQLLASSRRYWSTITNQVFDRRLARSRPDPFVMVYCQRKKKKKNPRGVCVWGTGPRRGTRFRLELVLIVSSRVRSPFFLAPITW
ncbi:hypothetical protein CROQUDRAFT_316557 [Cronartium quercuum f. sp. fusiforme G11]|uniref:Secreted protein n=1 Tax=Cronartium quercuum f. sp. fusiforme G11 TaxID=708437 RepID=A0A9P6NXI5_9BASI|nr:hypothetical protein CROQUDRAFT_316557 [Cronartium quercuum f. sp. fusiforme G11]